MRGGLFGLGLGCDCGGTCHECGQTPYSPAAGLKYEPPVPAPIATLKPGAGVPMTTLQQDVLANQRLANELFFSSAMPSAIAGNGYFVDAMMGAPRAALSGVRASRKGLAGLFTPTCTAFDHVFEALKIAVQSAVADTVNLNRAREFIRAQESWNPFEGRSAKFDCEEETAYLVELLNAVNADLTSQGVAPVGVPLAAQEAYNEQRTDTDAPLKPPEDFPLWGKIALIGGISVVGVIGIAVITGQVAPLLRTVKKVVR